jgi:hypothetical protein
MLKAAILDNEIKGSKLLAQKLSVFENELQVVAVFNDPEQAVAITRLNKQVAEKASYRETKVDLKPKNWLALPTAEGVYIVDKFTIIRGR